MPLPSYQYSSCNNSIDDHIVNISSSIYNNNPCSSRKRSLLLLLFNLLLLLLFLLLLLLFHCSNMSPTVSADVAADNYPSTTPPNNAGIVV